MNRKRTVPIILCVIWLVIVAWQVIEHYRFKEHARTALLNRARDITNSLATVIRSQRHFGGLISQNRLDSALQDLIKLEELRSISLLNAFGEVVTSVGTPTEYDINNLPETGERWNEKSVTFVNLVDLGIDPSETEGNEPPTLILQMPEPGQGPGPGRDREQGPPPNRPEWMNQDVNSPTAEFSGPNDQERNPGPGQPPPRPEWMNPDINSPTAEIAGRIAGPSDTDIDALRKRDRRGDRRRGPPRFDRPFWMSETQFQSLLKKQGLHGFVLDISTNEFNRSLDKDLWMRTIIGAFSLLAMVGIWSAWRNLIKSSELQLRLVRASEMNVHLREMNVAAAGLAHETRNPLNIVRGLAQLIAKQTSVPDDIRDRSLKITEEVDRVTAQLNEFIDYSKPREPKPAPVIVNSIVADVERALRSDLEDQMIQFKMTGPELTIDADESLLRQVIFNLLLNSIQSVPQGGSIEITVERLLPTEAYLEIRDDGPGVSIENQDKIFQPYFTTHKNGTGLGLAVVRQIVMSHGWNIEYRSTSKRGATFRVSGLKIVSKVSE